MQSRPADKMVGQFLWAKESEVVNWFQVNIEATLSHACLVNSKTHTQTSLFTPAPNKRLTKPKPAKDISPKNRADAPTEKNSVSAPGHRIVGDHRTRPM
ncbi:unnamed protein product [Ilex paraguariensis]|uniref:Uncharacterized protein n=1 Tax=Ilex paraguariensis TaxID=185542 RepID=A0ABC8UZT0_9AQUA